MEPSELRARIAGDVEAARRLAVVHVGIEAGLLRFLRAAGRPFIPEELAQKLDLDAELVAAWCSAALACGLVVETPNGTVRGAPCLADLPLESPASLRVADTLARIVDDLVATPALMKSRARIAPERHGAEWIETRANSRLDLACSAARAAASLGMAPRAAAVDGLRRESDLPWLRREIPNAEWRLIDAGAESPLLHATASDLLIVPATLHEITAPLQRARVTQLRALVAPRGAVFVVELEDDPFLAMSLAACGRAALSRDRAASLLEGAGFVAVRDAPAPSESTFGLIAESPCDVP
ncbi:MAG: hypothetical protein HY292_06460 [Planctomycetes bacterium]|nr:hypothetical protein [Planctomycetota bacterium]